MNLFYLTCERTSFQSGGGGLLQVTSYMHCIIKHKNKRILSNAWCMHLTFPERTTPQDTHAQLLLPPIHHTLKFTHIMYVIHILASHIQRYRIGVLSLSPCSWWIYDQHLAMCLDIFQNPCQNKCISLGRIPSQAKMFNKEQINEKW